MYVVVSYTRVYGHVIRPGLSLVQAYHLLAELGHGAIFRAEGMSLYARPVYPWLRPRPRLTTMPSGMEASASTQFQGRVA